MILSFASIYLLYYFAFPYSDTFTPRLSRPATRGSREDTLQGRVGKSSQSSIDSAKGHYGEW